MNKINTQEIEKLNNYKHIRRKVYLYDFDKNAFFVFVISVIVSLLSFLGGFSFFKLIGVGVFLAISFVVCKYVISNERLLNSFLDNKLPKKYSDYE